MSGRILQAMMMVLTCYVASQKHGSVAAEAADSSDLVARLERLEATYERNMQKQNEINSQQAEVIAEQSDRMADLELKNQKQARVIAVQGERIGYLELDQHQQDNILAFTASASEKRSYNEGDPMAFDSVLRNYGDSYDSVTSTFTCSVSGYYLFSMTVMTDGDNVMRAQMQLDDTPLVAAYANNWDAGSNLVVTYCAVGQRVWVMCHDGQGRVMYEDGDRWSTFSGLLLTLG